MARFSIIVPVYNAEKYLSTCVASILNQSFGDFEILLIDDGSSDNSGCICDVLSKEDARIRVFHKTNGGVSSARNVGLDNAIGEWLVFIDADDSIDKNALESCVPFLEASDVIRFAMTYVFSNTSLIREVSEMSKEDYLSKIISRDVLLSVCSGAYRKKLFDDNKIRFNESLVYGEDWVVLCSVLSYARDCVFIKCPLYNYNKTHDSSCTNSFSVIKATSGLLALDSIICLVSPRFAIPDKCYATAKCKLVYQFVSSHLRGTALSDKKQRLYYRKKVGLSFHDIITGSVSAKMFILLFLYRSPLGYIM